MQLHATVRATYRGWLLFRAFAAQPAREPTQHSAGNTVGRESPAVHPWCGFLLLQGVRRARRKIRTGKAMELTPRRHSPAWCIPVGAEPDGGFHRALFISLLRRALRWNQGSVAVMRWSTAARVLDKCASSRWYV